MYPTCTCMQDFFKAELLMLLLSVYGQDHTASEGAQLSEYVCAVEAGLLERT